jgi:glycosyltransferase involved in cell wall biosynthesis
MSHWVEECPGFTIVIPTYRRRRSLERVLEGIRDIAYPSDRLEVVVVNDGGDDGTSEMVRSADIGFELTLLEQNNQGPGAARNLGVEHAKRPFVLFLDDDVEPLRAGHESVAGKKPSPGT